MAQQEEEGSEQGQEESSDLPNQCMMCALTESITKRIANKKK